MAIFSSNQPSLRARVLPRFPAQVVAGNGITITKSGGVYTFAVVPSELDTSIVVEATASLNSIAADATDVIQQILSVNLIPGDWDLSGVIYRGGLFGPTGLAVTMASLSLTTSVMDSTPGRFARTIHNPAVELTGEVFSETIPSFKLTLEVDATVYLLAVTSYITGTFALGGFIHAREVLMDIHKTRDELILEAADKLKIVGTGQSLEAEYASKLEGSIDPMLMQLASDGICEVVNTNYIPAEWFDALAGLLANVQGQLGGAAFSPQVKEFYEMQLKRLTSTRPSYSILEAEYF